ncbi:hypothetical protein BD560DRAFT_440193 [Blakeslea trispora]|nr:hypothetical protein BD560DRAFT_440193 [Blakeslea trispora]
MGKKLNFFSSSGIPSQSQFASLPAEDKGPSSSSFSSLLNNLQWIDLFAPGPSTVYQPPPLPPVVPFEYPTHDASIALPVGTSTSPSHKPTPVISKKAKGQEQAKNQSSSAVSKTCGESGHTRSSSSKCKFQKATRQDGQIKFAYVDKYLTSQICNKCKSRTLSNVIDRNTLRRIHTILKSESCSTVWNRDVNAANNIRYVFTYQANHNNERPPIFLRPST